MKVFPRNSELLEFFEAEPTLSDPNPDIPWAYNRLEFVTRLGVERVECVVDNPQLEVRWFRDDVEQAIFEFHDVASLLVQEYPGGKCLVAAGLGPEQDMSFRLQLRPRVHLSLCLTQ